MTRRTPHRPPPPTIIRPSTIIDNNATTAQARIVSQISAGTHPLTAAVTAGMGEAEYRRYMTTGGRVMAEYTGGGDWWKDFTPDQHECGEFFAAVTKAAKIGESIRRTKLEQLARGELVTTRTVTKRDAAGTVLEETVTTEPLAPDSATLRWLLERESPEIYGARSELGLVVTDVSDTDTVGAGLLRVLAQMRNRPSPDDPATKPRADPIGTESAETPPKRRRRQSPRNPRGGGPL